MSLRYAGHVHPFSHSSHRLAGLPFLAQRTKPTVTRNADAGAAHWRPFVDVIEQPDGYEIQLEVPGVRADAINVECHERVLTISGEKVRDTSADDEAETLRHAARERRFGPFRRSFRLPSDVDEERIRAKCSNGVLSVTVPKLEQAGPTTIAIQS